MKPLQLVLYFIKICCSTGSIQQIPNVLFSAWIFEDEPSALEPLLFPTPSSILGPISQPERLLLRSQKVQNTKV
jgi:hypothetical protein